MALFAQSVFPARERRLIAPNYNNSHRRKDKNMQAKGEGRMGIAANLLNGLQGEWRTVGGKLME